MKVQREVKILAALVLGGLLLRLWHIHYGLPLLLLEDEAFFIQPALHVASGHIDPEWYGAPASPLIYGMGICFRLMSHALNAVMNVSLPPILHYANDTTLFHMAGRLITALAGAAMGGLAYWIGKEWSARAGVLAGIMVAGSFFLVEHSHIIRPDILQSTALLVLVLGWFRLLFGSARWRWYVVSGVAAGLAVSMKYPSIFFVLPTLCVVGVTVRRRKLSPKGWGQFLIAGAASLILTMPMLLWKFRAVVDDVTFENRTLHYGHDGLSYFENLWWYFSSVLPWQLGTVISVIVLGTSLACIWRVVQRKASTPQQHIALLFVAALTYLCGLSFLSLHWERWLIPVLPLLLLIAAYGIDRLLSQLRLRWARVLLLVVLFAGPAARLVIMLHSFSLPHTEELAEEWMRANLPATEVVLLAEPYTPVLDDTYNRIQVPNFAWEPLKEYRALGVTHLVTSDRVESIIRDGVPKNSQWDVGINQVAAPVYRKLNRQTELLAEFSPLHGDLDALLRQNDAKALSSIFVGTNRGPAIRIYVWPEQ